MNTVFILENEKLGTWYVGKIHIKMGKYGFPIHRTVTQDQLNDNLYKKYNQYENPYINLIFLNESHHVCHGIERWLTLLDYKIKRDPEKYKEIKKLLTSGWSVNDTLGYSSIYVLNIPEDDTSGIYENLKKNWGSQSNYNLTTCLNVKSRTRHERYIKNKQNPKFLFEQALKYIVYRMNKGYTPKKSTLNKYNLS
jgi:hypothetical protein|tara:strand:+ start:253 stop:837 length:585 start_codon:yes stop_codon:yes gene_type:complete